MGFLIRSAFWLSLVLLLIPFGGNGEETVGPVEAFVAARGAVQDMAGMCERRPEVCQTGRSALNTIGIRAREGARLAYTMIEPEPREDEPAILTGTVSAQHVLPAAQDYPAAPAGL